MEELRTTRGLGSGRAAPNAVLRLRDELSRQGCGDLIEYHWGRGYRLIGLRKSDPETDRNRSNETRQDDKDRREEIALKDQT